MERVLTPEDVAEKLQVQPITVKRWLTAGKLPGVKIGRLWRVRVEDLEEWLKNERQESAARIIEQLREDHKGD